LVRISKPEEAQTELKNDIVYSTPESNGEKVIGYRLVTELPSRFIPYDVNELYFRGFNVGEIKTLNNNRSNTSSDFFLKIIKDIIKGIDPKELTLIDAKAILIQSMMVSVGDVNWTYTSYCPECGHENVISVGVEDLDFTELEAPKLPVSSSAIDYNGEIVKFDAFRLKHLIEAEKFAKRNKNADMETIMLSTISNIRPLEKAYEFFSTMPLSTLSTLKKINEILFHDISPLEIKCCNRTASILVSDEVFNANFKRFEGFMRFEDLKGVRIELGTSGIKRQKLTNSLDADEIEYEMLPCGHTYTKTLDISLESLTPSDTPRGSAEPAISFG